MRVVELPIDAVEPAEWNPNESDERMRSLLRRSIEEFGIVSPIVVRQIDVNRYETIGGAQRLTVLRELQVSKVPCVVVDADNARARLLGQALNHIAGDDNPGLRARVVREMLESLSEEEIMGVLPESADSLRALASLGQDDIATHLEAWQKAQAARLRHLQFQLTNAQLQVVARALEQATVGLSDVEESPNRRGTALALVCRAYLASRGGVA